MADTALTLDVSSNNVKVNEQFTMTARLVDMSSGAGVDGRQILFYIKVADPNVVTWTNIAHAITTTLDSTAGVAEATFTFTAAQTTGNWLIWARWIGDTSYTLSESNFALVVMSTPAPPIPYLWIMVGIVGVVAVGGTIWYLIRKKKSPAMG